MKLPNHLPSLFHQRRALLLALVALAAALVLLAAPRSANAATTTVRVGQNASGAAAQRFNPASITISSGDTVRWEWFNGSHDIQSTNAPGLSSGPRAGFNSPGQAYQYAFTTAGTYTYYCDEHAGPSDAELDKIDQSLAGGKMVGKIVVQQAAGGSLSLSARPVTFPAVALSGMDQDIDAALQTWRASDARGTGAGWNVTITGANLTSGAQVIPADRVKVRLLQSRITIVSGNTAPQTQIADYEPLNPAAPLKLLRASAGTGMGTYDFIPDFRLTLPASTWLGEYTAALVVTVNSGP
ncbi:MAG: hypothetical protein C0506_12445 [Anaerolinea sp.]|nr:hypothetical protein [Anaerolinea sp.]